MPISVFNKQKGFTLVELMVVISIIALLSAIGLTIFSQAQIAGRDGKRLADMQEIQKALEQYYAIFGVYPAGTGTDINLLNALNTYFQNTTPPSDPNKGLSGSEYKYYQCAAAGGAVTGYNICARMERCEGKCNMPPGAPSGCVQVGSPPQLAVGSQYCLKSLSN